MYLALLLARLALAALFFVAAVSKLLGGFASSRKSLIPFGVPQKLAAPISIAWACAEIIIACLLLPASSARIGAVSALALLLIFNAAIAANLAVGKTPNCNCFGQLHSQPISWLTFVRSGALVALAGRLVWQAKHTPTASLLGVMQSLNDTELVMMAVVLLAFGAIVVLALVMLQLFRQNGRLLLRMEALEARLGAANFGAAVAIAVLFSFGCGGGGSGGGGGGGTEGPPNFTITKTHQGNFTQGQQNATYTVTVSNSGGSQRGGGGVVTEMLPSGLTLVSMAGTGWTCNLPQPPGCIRSDPLAHGATYPSITVTVNVATNATSPQINVATTCCAADKSSVNASDSTTILPVTPAGGLAVLGTSVPFPIFAGDPMTSIPITVTNDSAGDVLAASLTVDSNTGLPCTPATCGMLGSVTGTSGSGSYSVSYTPPPASGFTTQIVPTLVASSSLPGSFAATDFIEVDPPGAHLLSVTGIGGYVQAGTAARTVTVTVLNDATPPNGVTVSALTASGYACASTTANIGTNSCGTLGPASGPMLSGTTSTTTFTYTPPAPVAAPATSPAAPYDRPRFQVTSVADSSQAAVAAFLVNNNPAPANTGLGIFRAFKYNSVLAAPGATPLPVVAVIANDTGNSRTVTWTLTDMTGASCSPACGSLGSQVDTGNGTSVSSQINYTPPISVPTVAADLTPTIKATSVDNTAATDSFTFTIADGSCGTGHEPVLSGQYAFLVRGGGMVGGYTAIIGSFTANGAGGITNGLLDFNTSGGPGTGTILSAGSSYTVGVDNRACLVLADSTGGVENFRASVGTLVSGVATEGRIIQFNDNNGRRGRQSGFLMKQTPPFATSQISGTYALGAVGMDSDGGRFAGAGVLTGSGAGVISSFTADFDDAGTASGNATGGTGTYTVATNGRGTSTTTITVVGKSGTSNLVLYMVSSSEILFMSTDSLVAGHTIFSGELKKQTGPFVTTTFDNSDYVSYAAGLGTNGGNDTIISQATFTTNGNANLTSDENNNGTLGTEQVTAATFIIASNGRTTISGSGVGMHPPILYLIDSNSAFIVGTDPAVSFGFLEKQTGGPFSDASISGLFFFGGDAPTTGSHYDSGTATFDGAGGITGTDDSSGPNGLRPGAISPTMGGTYSFSTSFVPQGKGNVGNNSIAYIISGSKLIFMQTGQNPEVYVIQK